MGARALIAILLAAACAGPDPSAAVISVAPSPEPGKERVMLHVRNDGRHGEVTLELTPRGRGGRMVRDTLHIDMKAHERLEVAVDVPAPADSYTATVQAKYPD